MICDHPPSETNYQERHGANLDPASGPTWDRNLGLTSGGLEDDLRSTVGQIWISIHVIQYSRDPVFRRTSIPANRYSCETVFRRTDTLTIKLLQDGDSSAINHLG